MSGASAHPEGITERSPAAYAGLLFGSESEYVMVDRETLAPGDYLDVVAAHPAFGTLVKPELVRHQVELVSGPCASLLDLREEMKETLREVDALLDEARACLLPVSVVDWIAPRRSRLKRYRVIRDALGGDFTRNASFIASDQINVGAPDEASAFRIFRALVDAIPVFVGLGAASPFRKGVANGDSSNRLTYYDLAFSRYPQMAGLPPPLTDLEAYHRLLAGLPVLNRPDTYYGYIRPMPQRGVAGEIRCLDKQPTLQSTMAFFALAKAVARRAMDSTAEPLRWPWSSAYNASGLDRGFDDAFRSSRNGGLSRVVELEGMLGILTDHLPEEERGLLGPLSERVRDGPPAAEMTEFAIRHGMEHLHRRLIHDLRAEYATRDEATHPRPRRRP